MSTRERPILMSAPMVRAIIEGRKTQTRRIVKSQPLDDWHPQIGNFHPTKVDRDGEEYPGEEVYGASDENHAAVCSYGKPGDRLWVRETWAAGACSEGLSPKCLSPSFYGGPRSDNGGLWYAADGALPAHRVTDRGRWRPSIHMPRWAGRITLEIVSVRVERLQDITEEDAIAEGVKPYETPEHWAMMTRDGGCLSALAEPSVESLASFDVVHVQHVPSKQLSSARDGFATLWRNISGPASWNENPWVWRIEFKRQTS